MTVKLANILRALLKDHDTYVPLSDELSFTDDYLDIEVVRFGAEKLRVEKEIDPRTLEVLVPSILLQPLIENSIKHGLEPRIHGGTVTCAAALRATRASIEVADDGVGMGNRRPRAAPHGAGIGMKNVQERLEVLYGNQARFSVVSNPGRGTLVSIEIPANLPPRVQLIIPSKRVCKTDPPRRQREDVLAVLAQLAWSDGRRAYRHINILHLLPLRRCEDHDGNVLIRVLLGPFGIANEDLRPVDL
jgi:anti-sigma regulatory factor (Ser/Thr protein kinase)